MGEPTIFCIHASDAPQHTEELKAILLRMKTENRISNFDTIDISSSPNLSLNGGEASGIIVLLTHGIEQVRKEIEKRLTDLNRANGVRLIEIIVDNLPYHNSFISFPQDLKPIRTRDDMNLVWVSIEKNLQELFPMPKIEVAEPRKDPIEILKPIGLSVGSLFFRLLRSIGAFLFYFFLSIIFWIAVFTELFDHSNNAWGSTWLLTGLTIVVLMVFRHRRKQAKRKRLEASSS
jgi:hypothetical protein